MHGILLHKEEEMVRRQYEQKDLHPACTADGNDDTAHAHTRHIHFLLLEFFLSNNSGNNCLHGASMYCPWQQGCFEMFNVFNGVVPSNVFDVFSVSDDIEPDLWISFIILFKQATTNLSQSQTFFFYPSNDIGYHTGVNRYICIYILRK